MAIEVECIERIFRFMILEASKQMTHDQAMQDELITVKEWRTAKHSANWTLSLGNPSFHNSRCLHLQEC